MSLKAFHVIFITAASALCFGCAVWAFRAYWSPVGHLLDLFFGVGSVLAGVALIIYERYFLRKLKHVDYL